MIAFFVSVLFAVQVCCDTLRYKPRCPRYTEASTTRASATRLNTGGVEPHSSLWGPTEKGQIEDALEIQPVQQYTVTWTKVNQANGQGVKYMFVPLHSRSTTRSFRMTLRWQWWSIPTTILASPCGTVHSMMPSLTCFGA